MNSNLGGKHSDEVLFEIVLPELVFELGGVGVFGEVEGLDYLDCFHIAE